MPTSGIEKIVNASEGLPLGESWLSGHSAVICEPLGTRTRARKKPIVVVAGEDGNGRKSLRILLEALCPDMHGCIGEIKDSIAEIKDRMRLHQSTGDNLIRRADSLAKKVLARAACEDA